MKTFYSINPGEFFVADELTWARRDLKLYFPFVDTGVDILAVPKSGSGKPVRIQVKESRPWSGDPYAPHSWHQIRKDKIKDADVFVFVTYLPKGRAIPNTFPAEFVVIPQANLRALCKKKKLSSGKYTFYFGFGWKKGRVIEFRERHDPLLDLTKYLDAWHLVR